MATQKEVANHLDLSDRRVRTLISEGILPASKGKGGLDRDACRIAYIRHLRGVASGQVLDQTTLDLNQERALLAASQRRKLDRENDLAEKMIAPVELLTLALQKCATQIVSNLEALPLQMKRMNPLLTGQDIHLTKKAIAKCRNSIAAMKIDMDD